MESRKYRSAGLVIESDFPLPSVDTQSEYDTLPDVRIIRRETESFVPDYDTAENAGWNFSPAVISFSQPDIAHFRVHQEGLVEVWPLTRRESDVCAYLVGSGLAVVLHFRGVPALHASAVEVSGSGVLFLGQSGAGKSTMAAALHHRGYRVLCDAIAAIEMAGANAIVHPDGRRLKLWDQAIDHFGLESRRVGKVAEGFEKYFIEGDSCTHPPVPVKELYFLERDQKLSFPTITPVATVNAAASIFQNAYRPYLVQEMGHRGLYFRTTVNLLRQATPYRLRRGFTFNKLDQVLDTLEGHWRELERT